MMQVSFSGMSVGVGSCAATFVLAPIMAISNRLKAYLMFMVFYFFVVISFVSLLLSLSL